MSRAAKVVESRGSEPLSYLSTTRGLVHEHGTRTARRISPNAPGFKTLLEELPYGNCDLRFTSRTRKRMYTNSGMRELNAVREGVDKAAASIGERWTQDSLRLERKNREE